MLCRYQYGFGMLIGTSRFWAHSVCTTFDFMNFMTQKLIQFHYRLWITNQTENTFCCLIFWKWARDKIKHSLASNMQPIFDKESFSTIFSGINTFCNSHMLYSKNLTEKIIWQRTFLPSMISHRSYEIFWNQWMNKYIYEFWMGMLTIKKLSVNHIFFLWKLFPGSPTFCSSGVRTCLVGTIHSLS